MRRALPLCHNIRVGADVTAWIERERRPGERANDVIRRKLGMPFAGKHRRPWRWRKGATDGR